MLFQVTQIKTQLCASNGAKQRQVRQLMIQMRHESIGLTINGFSTIDYTMLGSVISIYWIQLIVEHICIYFFQIMQNSILNLLILIQFRQSEQNYYGTIINT